MSSLIASLLLVAFLLTARLAPYTQCAAEPVDLAKVDKHLADNAAANLARLIEFVSIPSVSSDHLRASEVRRAAKWLQKDLISAGLENVQILETRGHPAVYADWLLATDPSAATVLIYGHFDVQPEDPVDLWDTPPFTPTVRDGKLYARGASDDKGHMYVPVAAIRALLAVEGTLPVNVKLLFEGEEEIGSPHLHDLLVAHSGKLIADYAFSADGGQVSTDIPGLCLGLRGSMSMEFSLRVADVDMHSGTYGGGVQNPIHAMAQLLSSLHDARTGKIMIDGFYGEVHDLTQAERDEIADFPVPEEEMLKRVGVNASAGEKGYSFYERTWCRPSVEVVGIWGGFQGEGIKTVLPREAHAKISCRLVSNQNVQGTLGLLKDHLASEAEKIDGVAISMKEFGFEADAFKMAKATDGNEAAAKVLKEVYGRPPVFFNMGGSIPMLGHLRKLLGLETTMFAFGHADENVHAPNEFARIDSFRRGERAYVRLFKLLGEQYRVGGEEEGEVKEEREEGKEEL